MSTKRFSLRNQSDLPESSRKTKTPHTLSRHEAFVEQPSPKGLLAFTLAARRIEVHGLCVLLGALGTTRVNGTVVCVT
jgi:hypothetical protein